MRRRAWILLAGLGLIAAVPDARAQDADLPPALEVGTVAPDFEIQAATQYGTLQEPIRLSDFEGKTVVLAFFFKARTRG